MSAVGLCPSILSLPNACKSEYKFSARMPFSCTSGSTGAVSAAASSTPLLAPAPASYNQHCVHATTFAKRPSFFDILRHVERDAHALRATRYPQQCAGRLIVVDSRVVPLLEYSCKQTLKSFLGIGISGFLCLFFPLLFELHCERVLLADLSTSDSSRERSEARRRPTPDDSRQFR